MEEKCPVCKKKLGILWDRHHLKPKSLKGKKTVKIHRICHNKIHSVFTERQLNNYYHTIERLLENEHIQRFIKWVKNKDPDFYEKTRQINHLKKRNEKV